MCYNIIYNKKKYIKFLVILNKNCGFYFLIKCKNIINDYYEIIIYLICRIFINFKILDLFNDIFFFSIYGVNSCIFI